MNSIADVVIVNFRTKELTYDAAHSVLAEPGIGEVIIVENGSGDDSGSWLQMRLAGSKVKVLLSEKNLGFGGGNNLGVASASAEFVFLLNSDATLLTAGLARLIEKLQDPTIGIAAPAILMPDGKLQPNVYGLFPTPARILSRQASKSPETNEPDWVSGAAMMLRRQEFLDLGGFDQQLFMYMEDVDLCKRYRDKGLRIVREPSAQIIHLGGRSMSSTKSQKEQFRKSTDYYLEKHGFSPASRAAVRAVRSIIAKMKGT